MKVLQAITTAIAFVLIILLALFLTVAVGYFLGSILTLLPFVSGWLTAALPISAGQIPAITAWIAVAGIFIGGGSKVRAKAGDIE